MNINTLDLNLLRLFAIIYRTRSVAKAAETLCLSQPATSNALARLRQALNDPLFVRSRQGMVPTPEAERIAPHLLHHFDGLAGSIIKDSEFDLSFSHKTFNLSLSGLGEAIFLPALAQRVMNVMPNAKITNQSLALNYLQYGLEHGVVDLAIGMMEFSERGVQCQPLYEDGFVAIYGAGMKKNHDLSQNKGKVMEASLATSKLVLAAPSATYAKDLELLVRQLGLSSNVVLNIRHFSGLHELLETLDLVAIVPQQMAAKLQNGTLTTLPLPTVAKTVNMIWHQRSDNDAANIWLREQVLDLYSQNETN